MKFIRNAQTNPYWNMAFESYCFENIATEEDYFFIWKNEPSIVLGRHQNVFEEINPHFVYRTGLPLVRRISGGGAVYHDLGNINFTFIYTRKHNGKINYTKHNKMIQKALLELGIETSLSARHDILLNGMKISGNAQKIYKDRVLHHGTLLYKSDLKKLEGSLYTIKKNMRSKSTKSVRSQVTNICDQWEKKLSIKEFEEHLIGYLSNGYNDEEIYLNTGDKLKIERKANEIFCSWNWIYGESPPFCFKNEMVVNGVHWQLDLSVRKGYIEKALVYKNGTLEEVALRGLPYDRKTLPATITFMEEIQAANFLFGEEDLFEK